MQHFAPIKLMEVDEIGETSIQDLCNFYDLDSTVVARELSEFRVAYRSVHSLVDLNDLQPTSALIDSINPALSHLDPGEPATDEQLCDHDDDNDDDDEEKEGENGDSYAMMSMSDFDKWTDYSFVKPLRVIYQLTGYPSLTTLYKILASLAVTICGTVPQQSADN